LDSLENAPHPVEIRVVGKSGQISLPEFQDSPARRRGAEASRCIPGAPARAGMECAL